MAIHRRFLTLACASLALVTFLTDTAEARMIRRSIAIDGAMEDWQVVLLNPQNTLRDMPYNEGDLDPQPDGSKDLQMGAATWDSDYLYLYLRRTVRGPGSRRIALVWYLDVNHDGLLDARDFLLAGSFWPDRVDEVHLYRYVPAASADPIPGDGVAIAGHGTLLPDAVNSSMEGDRGVEYEFLVPWSALGVSPGSPLTLRPASLGELASAGPKLDAAIGGLPAGIQDNAPALDTAFHEFTLSDGRTLGAVPGTWADFPHQVQSQGNVADTINLWADSPDGLRLELWSDPNGDGDSADGSRLALDANGDGDFIDPTDNLSPGSDSDLDLRPDSGPLAPAARRHFIWRTQMPAPVSSSRDFHLQVNAASAAPTESAATTDIARAGGVSVFSARDLSVVEGSVIDVSHTVCNQLVADSIELQVSSVLGWLAVTLHGGTPVGSVVLGGGNCTDVVVRIEVPAPLSLGTIEQVTLKVKHQSSGAEDLLVDRLVTAGPVTLRPDRALFGVSGTTVFHPHRLVNSTSVARAYRLQATSSLSARATFWTDPDGDGNPADGMPVLVTPSVPPVGGALSLVVQLDLPGTASEGDVDQLLLSAIDSTDAGVSAQATDVTTIRVIGSFAADYPAPAASEFPGCATVFAAAGGLPTGTYRYRWYDPNGNLVRMSAPKPRDGMGLVRDSLVLFATDPLGDWQLRLEFLKGVVWEPVDPGGLAGFTVLGDLRPEGGVVGELRSNLRNYPLSGASMNVTSLLVNSSPFKYDRSRVDYVVFYDTDGNGTPDTGEPFFLADGTQQSWSKERFTCRASALPAVLPAAGLVDSSCQNVGPIDFPRSGAWSLAADWRTECGYLIASRTAQFNAGCGAVPAPDAGPDRLICQGDAVQLGPATPTAGTGWSWSPVDFLDDPAIERPWATPLTTTTYVLSKIELGSGCVGEDEVLVQVNAAPAAEVGPSATICRGESRRIGAPAIPGMSYSWSPTTGLDDPLSPDPLATPDATTIYSLTVTDPGTTCARNATTVITVVPPPVADAGSDRSGPGPIGPDTCNPALGYTWSPDSGLDDATACNPIATPAGSQVYCLTVLDLGSDCSGVPDCTLVTVTPCVTVPPRVSALLTVRSGTDVLLGWDVEPLAAGGYHVYRTDLVQNLALPPSAGVLVASTIALPSANAASDLRAVEAASGARLFYRVVAVCGDGSTEGP